MDMLPDGARRFPASRRRRVVFPAPLAPINSVRLFGGSETLTSVRPREWSWKA